MLVVGENALLSMLQQPRWVLTRAKMLGEGGRVCVLLTQRGPPGMLSWVCLQSFAKGTESVHALPKAVET